MNPRHDALVAIKDAFAMMQGASTGFLARVERELALSSPHVAVLEAVKAGATKVGDVAGITRTHVSSASRTVDALVEDGLLLREQDPSDRRAVILSLTPTGEQRMARFDELQIELMDAALHSLDGDALGVFAQRMSDFGLGVVEAVAQQSATT